MTIARLNTFTIEGKSNFLNNFLLIATARNGIKKSPGINIEISVS